MKLKDLNEKKPISFISNKIQYICGKHQLLTLVAVIALFSLFLYFIIYKNFIGIENIILKCMDKKILSFETNPSNLMKIASFLTDFASLPLLILTIMFSTTQDYTSSIEQAINNTLLTRISTDLDEVKQAQTDLRNLYSEKNLERASEPELYFSLGSDKLDVDKPNTQKIPSEKINKNINKNKPSSNDKINFNK